MFISFFIPIKKQANKILFFNILPILIVSIVAFGRIIAGAHYMSDTIFGGTIMFSILCGIFYIHYKYKMHLLHK
jgi:membrane-associated phospholipid phosphatase